MATTTTTTETHYSDDELCFDPTCDNTPAFVADPLPTAREMSKAGPWGINFSANADAVRANKRLDRKAPKSKSKVAALGAVPALPAGVYEAALAQKLTARAPRAQREAARKAERLAAIRAQREASEAAASATK